MNKIIVTGMLVMSTLATQAAASTEVPDMLKKYTCTACHAVDKKVVGPAFSSIAAKYKGDPAAKEKLSLKVVNGGGGVWGTMPMPANPKLSQTDAATMIDFILGLAK